MGFILLAACFAVFLKTTLETSGEDEFFYSDHLYMKSEEFLNTRPETFIWGGNLQSYWTTVKLKKLTVVLNYYEAMETYSGIGLLRSYGNLQSFWTTTKLWKLTVVLDYYEAMETYSRIGLAP